ncbi:MAG: hypothetical protein ACRC1H_01585 [Caldilineaceae bacterium]
MTTDPAGASPVDRMVRPAVPTRAEVDALMKRCQIGVGGRNALDNAHSIMAECYGTLGALMLEVERMRAGHDRYEIVRRMNVDAFRDAYVLNRRTGKPFDEIVADLGPFFGLTVRA